LLCGFQLGSAQIEDTSMTIVKKPAKAMTGKKQAASVTARVVHDDKKIPGSGTVEVLGPRQLRQADKMLTRIERKGEALSASADKLLRRVS
jgi:hypothetical protein